MTADLRRSQRHGLKDREEYDKAKRDFVTVKNPGQTHPVTSPLAETVKMTNMMTDTSANIFYGNYSRNDEDPTSWMQNLNTQRVANDWTDKKTINVFESLLAEDKKAYQWWHDELKAAEPTMDREDWATVQKEFKKRWKPLPEPEEDPETKREELAQMRLRDEDIGAKVTYQGQELYTHVAFTNQAAHLAN